MLLLAGVDWRHKLETQRGAVLATELKNNANKLAKWTAAALVSGVEIIKLGYVSRAHHRDTRSHVILGTQVCFCMMHDDTFYGVMLVKPFMMYFSHWSDILLDAALPVGI